VKNSPLKVKNYFVTGLSVKANPIVEGTQVPLSGAANVITKVEAAQRADNKRDWKVALQLNCEPAEKNVGSYVVSMELIGFFEVDNDFAEDRIGDVVAANAPAILYSAARELILLITGRGPFPPLSLPSATFIDETPSSKKRVAEAQKAAEAKAKQPAKV
jgi:preprotein translocase subunit SecB